MRFERELTTEAEGRYGEIEFVRATSEIRNPDGSVIFRLADIEVPKPLVSGGVRHPRPEVFPPKPAFPRP